MRAAVAANGPGTFFFTHTVVLTGTIAGTGQMSETESAGLDGSDHSLAVTLFTGTITDSNGQPHQGAIQILTNAVALPGSNVFNGTFSLQNGTGGLTGVHGQGTLSALGGVGTYQGQISFP